MARTPNPKHKQKTDCLIHAGMDIYLALDDVGNTYTTKTFTVSHNLAFDSHGRPTIVLIDKETGALLSIKLEELVCDLHIRKKAFLTKGEADKESIRQISRQNMKHAAKTKG